MLLRSIHTVPKYLHLFFFCPSEGSIHIPLPRFPCHPFFYHALSKFLTILSHNGSQPVKPDIITHLAMSPSTRGAQPGALLQVLSAGRISHHRCPSETSQRGQGLSPSTFRWCPSITRTHLKTGSKSSLSLSANCKEFFMRS